MNTFGYIKDTFNNILTVSLLKKDKEGKQLFSKYLKILKENEDLSQQYLIYKNLTTKKFNNESDAKEYIKENITLLQKINDDKGIKKLQSLLKGRELIKENVEIYNHINSLKNTIKSVSNLEKIQESINYITKQMLKEEVVEESEYETVEVPPSVLTKMATNRFNLKYQDITEGEKEIIKTILNGNDEDKENTYTKLKNECVDIIDNRLNENVDLDLKDKLLKVKDKLLRMTFNPDEYVKDINNVYELKNSVATEE